MRRYKKKPTLRWPFTENIREHSLTNDHTKPLYIKGFVFIMATIENIFIQRFTD